MLALAGVLFARSISATPEFPIHDAIKAYDPIAFLTALEAGTDPNARDAQGNAPLHLAVAQRNSDLVLALLFMGADPLTENAAGQNATDALVKPRGMTRLEYDRIETIRHDLHSFASDSRPFPDHPFAQASFFIAATRSIESLLRESVEAGADPNRPKTEKQETALHKTEDAGVVRTLAELGANLEAITLNDLTIATALRTSKTLRTLLRSGSTPAPESAEGQKLLSHVQQKGSVDVEQFVRSHPTYGPALVAGERAQAREREDGMAEIGAMITRTR